MRGETKATSKKGAKKKTPSPFSKYRGIGNPGIPSGRKGINKWLREMRGE